MTWHDLLRTSAPLQMHHAGFSENLVEETMKDVAGRVLEARRDKSHLDRCYGDIGISALVAALRYASETKNPAYAPVTPRVVETEAA